MSGEDFDDFGDDWPDEVLNEISSIENQQPSNISENNPDAVHLSALQRLFGHKQFKPLQWKIIKSILDEKRDNCAVMSTGYGKSLIFQYPSAYTGGVTFVVSPLISLMEDQVLSLKVTNIPACLLGTANANKAQTYNEISQNKYRLVYLTPEFCTSDHGKELLENWGKTLSITLIAIDEAHCVSSWGHDFRHEYRKLGLIRELIPNCPILAVTATATKKVRDDIIASLKLRNPQVTQTSFDRPNFYYEVKRKTEAWSDLSKFMQKDGDNYKFNGSTIIYCITRKLTEQISQILGNMGVNSAAYHAGLSLKIRKEVHEKFAKDEIDVIVATIAFGMGIDKPDIRNVIHYGVSDSIEGYYQEVGRAGRDGEPANCITFFKGEDFQMREFLRSKIANEYYREKKRKMTEFVQDYVNTSRCRRQFLLEYFEENLDTSKLDRCCDNCIKNKSGEGNSNLYVELNTAGKYDMTEDAKLLLGAIESVSGGKFGLLTYIQFLRGSGIKKLGNCMALPLHGAGKHKDEGWWKELGQILQKRNLLKKVASSFNKFVYLIDITKSGRDFLSDSTKKLIEEPTAAMLKFLTLKGNVWLNKTKEIPCASSSNRVIDFIDTTSENNLYKLLLTERSNLAAKEECMPYMVASNKALMQLAELKPMTIRDIDFMNIDGFTAAKISKFGEEFINVIIANCNGTNTIILPIIECLKKYPLLETTPVNTTASITFSLFKQGKSVIEIAKERGYAKSTIEAHLINCLKNGYEVKLSHFDITKNIAKPIIDSMIELNSGFSLVTNVKMTCPDEITFSQIKAVMAHLEIREHLTSKFCKYIEFDDPEYYEMYKNKKNEPKPPMGKIEPIVMEDNQSSNKPDLFEEETNSSDDFLLNACDELEQSLNQGNDEEPLLKKAKKDYSHMLDSPPREDPAEDVSIVKKDNSNTFTSSQEKESTLTNEDKSELPPIKKKEVKLPPWLAKKRVA